MSTTPEPQNPEKGQAETAGDQPYSPPAYQPPQSAGGYQPPAYQPPQSAAGYQPPAAYQPPQPATGYEPPSVQPQQSATGYEPPAYQPPQSAAGHQPPAYQPPQTASTYQPPAYQPPQTASTYQPPAVDSAYQPPAADATYQPPAYQPPTQASAGYQPPQAAGAPAAQPFPQAEQAPYGVPSPYGTQDPYGAPANPYGAPANPYAPVPGGYGYPAQPEYGYPPKATWGRRALGWLLDFLVPGIILGQFAAVVFPSGQGQVNWVSNLMSLVLWGALSVYSANTGQTWGRQVFKTQLVGEDYRPIGLARTFLRYLAHIVDSIILFIGWFFPLWDKDRQTLADKIMKTYVLDVSATGPININKTA